jgi:leucyl-tRNA synthetase
MPVSESTEVIAILNQTIKRVGEDIENFKFNTAISSMMVLANAFDAAEAVSKESFEKFLRILSPFAPHMTQELWNMLGNKKFILSVEWPVFDASKAVRSARLIMVQVNGKMRGQFEIDGEISEAEAIKKALGEESVRKWMEGKEPKKTIYVKGKLVSIVV